MCFIDSKIVEQDVIWVAKVKPRLGEIQSSPFHKIKLPPVESFLTVSRRTLATSPRTSPRVRRPVSVYLITANTARGHFDRPDYGRTRVLSRGAFVNLAELQKLLKRPA
jgi:hypothetical protein